MRILSLEDGFPPELASGRLPYEFSRELVRRGHKVTVVTVFPRRYLISEKTRGHVSEFFYWEIMKGIRVLRVQPEFSRTAIWARAVEYFVVPISLFFGGLLAGKSDAILCSSPPLFAAFAGCLLGKIRRVQVILRLQDIHPDALVKLGILKNSFLIRSLELIEKFIYKSVSAMTVISEGCMKLVVSKGIDHKKIELVPNWADVESTKLFGKTNKFRHEHGLSDKFVVTYAGVMSWPQDLETLVESANLLRDFRGVQFLLVGQGEQERLLKEKAQKLKLENVKFLPLQPRQTYFEILQASDVCLVSLKKSYTSPTVPSKMLDIMACSKPVIANVPKESDVRAIIEEASCGIWVEPENPEEFVQVVLRLYKNPKLREEMGKGGREYVETHLSLKACADQYEALIDSVLLKKAWTKRGPSLRRTVHRAMTYPILAPVILGYKLTKDSRMLDIFYFIRSIPHGFPMKNGLRLAKYEGNRIIFPSREDAFFDDVFLRGIYYPYKPQNKDVVFDVGAHMGFFTVKVGKHVKKLIAFEPDPYNFRFLLMNIQYNALSNARAFNYALGERDGYAFLKRGYDYGETRLTKTNTGYRVIVRALDTVVRELRVIPDVIKIDVEGHEMKVLEGAKSVLTCYKPRLVIASYHYLDEWKDVAKYLIRIGYRCFIYSVPLVLQKFRETYVYSEPS